MYEGTIVRSGAVLAAGTILTSSTKIYDLINESVIEPNEDGVIELPENAVVVPGARKKEGAFDQKHDLSIYSPVIIKYRDQKTESGISLEEILR